MNRKFPLAAIGLACCFPLLVNASDPAPSMMIAKNGGHHGHHSKEFPHHHIANLEKEKHNNLTDNTTPVG